MKKTGTKSEIVIYSIIAAACGIIILFSFQILKPAPDAVVLSGDWELGFEDRSLGKGRLPVYYSDGDDDFYRGLYSFGYNIRLESDYIKNLKNPVLVIPAVSGNGMRVRLNGEVLGCRGDINSGDSSVWNLPHVLDIPPGLLTENTYLDINVFSLYEAGLNRLPYLIDSRGVRSVKIFILVWMDSAMHFLIGSMIALGLVFVVTGLFAGRVDLQKIFLGLALFFISVFLLDYSFIDNTVIPYIAFKKTVIASQFLALMFFILYIAQSAGMLNNRVIQLISVFMFCLFLLTVFFPGDMVGFRKFYRLAYSSNLLLFGFLVYLFSSRRKRTLEMTTIFGGGFSALIFSIHDLLCLFIDGGQVFLSQYGLSILFLTGAAVMVYQIINSYIESVRQSERAEQFYAESMQDPLTGVYNRKILPAVESGLRSDFAVLLFDLDDFKDINDLYGHQAGDRALKAFSKVIIRIIRSNDYVIRIGGDEFIAVLPGCALDTAESQGGRIREKLEALELVSGGRSFNISATIGAAWGERGSVLSSIIAAADKNMYRQKNR